MERSKNYFRAIKEVAEVKKFNCCSKPKYQKQVLNKEAGCPEWKCKNCGTIKISM